MSNKEKQNSTRLDARDFFKRWPKFYYFVATVFGPMMFCGLSSKSFLKRYPREGMTINLGSGPRIISDEIINIDIYPYAGVKIIADAVSIPRESASVARIISDNVLEHVKDPMKAVAEMHRLLEAEGLAYISTPFIYPFHSSPNDYQRWSKEGLKELFHEFEIVEFGVRAGPFSALDVFLCQLTGTIFSFGSPFLNSLITNVSMFIFFPVKLLDVVFNYWPNADKLAAVLYCVVRKRI